MMRLALAVRSLSATVAGVSILAALGCGKAQDGPSAVVACTADGGCPSGTQCSYRADPNDGTYHPSECVRGCPAANVPIATLYESPDCKDGMMCWANASLGTCAQPCSSVDECAPAPPGLRVSCDTLPAIPTALCQYYPIFTPDSGPEADAGDAIEDAD